jgi:hypothetical protein
MVVDQLAQPFRPDRVVARTVSVAQVIVYPSKPFAFLRRFRHHSGSQVNVFELDVHVYVVGAAP